LAVGDGAGGDGGRPGVGHVVWREELAGCDWTWWDG
jgi:hypothetical protein